MKIITAPQVYIVGRQTMDQPELDRFLADHGVEWQSDSDVPAEVITETAGRVCYMSFARPRPGGNAAYLEHIKESSHGSVFEHGVWNILVTGVSRSLTHELIRHRAGFGFSQLSQRYVDESVAEYVEPAIIASDPELHEIWQEAIERSHAAYVKLAEKMFAKIGSDIVRCVNCTGDGIWWDHHQRIDRRCMNCNGEGQHPRIKSPTDRRKAARQAARSVLPNATETKIFITANARALRHFLEQRGSRHAEPEIRLLANVLLDRLRTESPHLFGDYYGTQLADGTYEIDTKYRKV